MSDDDQGQPPRDPGQNPVQNPPPYPPPYAQETSGQDPYGQWDAPPLYPQPPVYGYPAPAPERASHAMAGWALGLAIAPLCITWFVAIPLAIVVLRRGRDGRRHGKGMAIAALLVSAGWIVLLGALTVIGLILEETQAQRDSDGAIDQAGSISLTELRAGDCLADSDISGILQDANAVPCDDEHDFEVLGVIDMLAQEFPGEDQAFAEADARCPAVFREYVGVRVNRSMLELYYFVPVTEADFRADKSIVCMVRDPAGEVTGSLEGSRR